MLGCLIILFIFVPILELIFLIKVGQYIGAVNTVLIVIVTGILGAAFARSQGLRVLWRIQEDLASNFMPTEGLIDGAFILTGGILLITPGFFTDLIGLSFLLPFFRRIYKRWLKHKLRNMINSGGTSFRFYRYG